MGRQARGSASCLLLRGLSSAKFSDRVTVELQTQRLMYKSVEDRLCESRIGDMLIPVFWRKLGDENAGSGMVPVINKVGDFPGIDLRERLA